MEVEKLNQTKKPKLKNAQKNAPVEVGEIIKMIDIKPGSDYETPARVEKINQENKKVTLKIIKTKKTYTARADQLVICPKGKIFCVV